MSSAHFLTPLLEGDEHACRLFRNDDPHPVVTTLECAFDSRTRNRGLLGRDGLADDAALILAPCNSVHTWYMRFAIDIVFVARDGRVVKIRRGVRPWRIAIGWRAFATIEGAAGMAARCGLQVGDRLSVRRIASV
jgi:uncharacterized membrane protein (UPF0127 family)